MSKFIYCITNNHEASQVHRSQYLFSFHLGWVRVVLRSLPHISDPTPRSEASHMYVLQAL